MLSTQPYLIETNPEELTEGLFGQIFLYVFEILPALHRQGQYPAWAIRTRKYGSAPDFTVVPGVLDLAYEPPAPQDCQRLLLADARRQFVEFLGNDWQYVHDLWHSYFRIPQRVIASADGFGDLSNALGLHYRGTDKNTDAAHTNPVQPAELLQLTEEFIAERPQINTIFLATDEHAIVEEVKRRFPKLRILDTGAAATWNSSTNTEDLRKGDHAVLDCVLLSRCRYLLKCQSALSGFAKVLNPKLEAYRISASKLFIPVPYFPDAYIPRLQSTRPENRQLLERLMRDDWLELSLARKQFGPTFKSKRESEIRIHWRRRLRSKLGVIKRSIFGKMGR